MQPHPTPSDPTAALSDAFLVAMGKHFAPPESRAKWATHRERALRRSLPRAYALRLYERAVAAWIGAPPHE